MSNSLPLARSRFWNDSWLGRALKLTAANALGGAWVGALIGFSNWSSLRGNTLQPWWEWTAFTALYSALWMAIPGFLLGAAISLAVALVSARWNARRKWRFARAFDLCVLLPIFVSFVFTSLIAVGMKTLDLISPAADFGNILGYIELITLVAANLFFTVLLAIVSRRPLRRTPRASSRLLPAN